MKTTILSLVAMFSLTASLATAQIATPPTGARYASKADSMRAVAAELEEAADAADEFAEEQNEYRREVIDANEERAAALREYREERAKADRKSLERAADLTEKMDKRDAKLRDIEKKRQAELADAQRKYDERIAKANAEAYEDSDEVMEERLELADRKSDIGYQRKMRAAGTDAERVKIEREYQQELAKAAEECAIETREAIRKADKRVDKEEAVLDRKAVTPNR